jgi:hypothetical protein
VASRSTTPRPGTPITDERPIETLAAILELPYVHQHEQRLYVWPFAFACRADTLSVEEKEQLTEAIGEDGVNGIDGEGDWVFYVPATNLKRWRAASKQWACTSS